MAGYTIEVKSFKSKSKSCHDLYEPHMPKIGPDDEGEIPKVSDGKWITAEDESGGSGGRDADVVVISATVSGDPIVEEDDVRYSCSTAITAEQVWELAQEGKSAIVRISLIDESGVSQIISMPLVRAIHPHEGQYNTVFIYMEAAVDTPGYEYPVEYTFSLETKDGSEATPNLLVHKVKPIAVSPATKDKLGVVIVGDNLKVDDEGRILVDVANKAEQDNTKPITSAAVYTEIGNIDALLQTI